MISMSFYKSTVMWEMTQMLTEAKHSTAQCAMLWRHLAWRKSAPPMSNSKYAYVIIIVDIWGLIFTLKLYYDLDWSTMQIFSSKHLLDAIVILLVFATCFDW